MNLEKDSGNLRLLVSLWDVGEGCPWQPFYRGAKRWPAGQGWLPGGQPMWPFLLYFIPKEGEGGRLATNLWPTGHAWPPLKPYFHPPLHLASIMLTPLTKSIKSKANSFHTFPKFFLFIFEIFGFYIMQ
jgi:hypothetical protein